MSKPSASKFIPIDQSALHQALYDALAKLDDIRAEMVVASEVLGESAFSGSNKITDDLDVCAVGVYGKGVRKLSALMGELDQVCASLCQPAAIARLKAVAHE